MSDPANDPDTCTVPPSFGNVKPPPPDVLTPTEYPEIFTALGCTDAGAHVTPTETGLEVSRLAQALVGVERFEESAPFCTVATLEPDVAHPEAVRWIVVFSALVPVAVSGGVKATVPAMSEHLTPPVATVADEVPEPELHAAPSTATRSSGTSAGARDAHLVT